MQLPDLSNPLWFLVATIVVFAVVIGRYFLIAGLFYYVFYKWSGEKWKPRKINNRDYKQDQFKKEVTFASIPAL